MTATVRPAIELDGDWRFVRDPQREHEASSLPDGEPISVPGCWEAQVTDPYRVVTAWYHRTIEIPSAWQDRTAVIAFGAVMYRCVVFLNGERVVPTRAAIPRSRSTSRTTSSRGVPRTGSPCRSRTP